MDMEPPKPDARALRFIGDRSCHVLIVAEEPVLATVTGRLIRLAGGLPAVATDRCDAIERLRQRPFDLVLIDLSLAGHDGPGLVALARALQPDTLIAVSNGILGQDDDLPPEGDLYVYMPYNLDLLRGLVVAALGRRARGLKGA